MEIFVKEYSISIYTFISRELLNKYGIEISYTQQEITDLLIKKIQTCLYENRYIISDLEGLNVSISLKDDIYSEDIEVIGSVNLLLLSESLNIGLSSHLLKDIFFTEISVENNTQRIESTIAHELVHLIDSTALMTEYENKIKIEDKSVERVASILSLYRNEGLARLYQYLLGYTDIGSEKDFSNMYNALSAFTLYSNLNETGKEVMSKMFDIQRLLDIVTQYSYELGPIMIIEGLYHLTTNDDVDSILQNVIDSIKEQKKVKLNRETTVFIIKEAIKYSPFEYFSKTFLCEEGTQFNYEDRGGKEGFSALLYSFKGPLEYLWKNREAENIFVELQKKKKETDALAEKKKIEAEILIEKQKAEFPIMTAIKEEITKLQHIANKKSKHHFTRKERKLLRRTLKGDIPSEWEYVFKNNYTLKSAYTTAIDNANKASLR